MILLHRCTPVSFDEETKDEVNRINHEEQTGTPLSAKVPQYDDAKELEVGNIPCNPAALAVLLARSTCY